MKYIVVCVILLYDYNDTNVHLMKYMMFVLFY